MCKASGVMMRYGLGPGADQHGGKRLCNLKLTGSTGDRSSWFQMRFAGERFAKGMDLWDREKSGPAPKSEVGQMGRQLPHH